jgi:hypothetical protein
MGSPPFADGSALVRVEDSMRYDIRMFQHASDPRLCLYRGQSKTHDRLWAIPKLD